MSLNENLKWRYAAKKYDTSKKIAKQDINYIKEAVQLAASSYGLQPYKVLDVLDPRLREALKPKSWGQSQITDASHLFVFCGRTDMVEKDVEEIMQLKAEINGVEIDSLNGYGNFVKGKLNEKLAEEVPHWTAKQVYIALANAMAACAELRIDCTPIEGFEPAAYNDLLNLNQQGFHACVVLAIGYRHADDTNQHSKKVRKSLSTLFEER